MNFRRRAVANPPSQLPWRLTAGDGKTTEAVALRWVYLSGGGLVWLAHDPTSVPTATVAVRAPRVSDIDRVKVPAVVAAEAYTSPGAVPTEFQVPAPSAA